MAMLVCFRRSRIGRGEKVNGPLGTCATAVTWNEALNAAASLLSNGDKEARATDMLYRSTRRVRASVPHVRLVRVDVQSAIISTTKTTATTTTTTTTDRASPTALSLPRHRHQPACLTLRLVLSLYPSTLRRLSSAQIPTSN